MKKKLLYNALKRWEAFEISPQREKEMRDRERSKNNPLELRP